jgi:hypothetical protein
LARQWHCNNGQPNFIVHVTPDCVKWVS